MDENETTQTVEAPPTVEKKNAAPRKANHPLKEYRGHVEQFFVRRKITKGIAQQKIDSYVRALLKEESTPRKANRTIRSNVRVAGKNVCVSVNEAARVLGIKNQQNDEAGKKDFTANTADVIRGFQRLGLTYVDQKVQAQESRKRKRKQKQKQNAKVQAQVTPVETTPTLSE